MACLLLGLVTLGGWYLRIPRLLQLGPTLAPLQFNAALALVFLGTGFLVRGGSPWAVRACTLFPVSLGLLTLAEYVFDVDLLIDQLLFRPYLTVGTVPAGRIAANSAVCYTAVALALFVATARDPQGRRAPTVAALGSVALGLAGLALVGYATGIEEIYGWGTYTRMPVQGAVAILLLSVACIASAWEDAGLRDPLALSWLPVPVGVLVFTAVLGLWQAVAMVAEGGFTEPEPGNVIAATFAVALASAALIAAVVYFGQRAVVMAQDLEVLNRHLHEEQAQRERMLVALQQSEALHRTVAREFPNGVVLLFDRDLRYVLVDGRGLGDAGLSKQALEGKTIWEALAPETCAIVEPYYRAALDGHTSVFQTHLGGSLHQVHVVPVEDVRRDIQYGLVMVQKLATEMARRA